jgi:hypothetical protein
VAGRVEHVEAQALDVEPVTLRDAHRDHVDAALLAHHGDAMRAVAQRPEAGDVVGVQVRVHRLDELQVELSDELQVAVDLFQDGIDDEGLAAAPAGEEIGVGAGGRVEELTEDHRLLPEHDGRKRQPVSRTIMFVVCSRRAIITPNPSERIARRGISSLSVPVDGG